MSDEQAFDPHAIIDGHHSEPQRFNSTHEALVMCPRGKRQMRERIIVDQWTNMYATHSADVKFVADGSLFRLDACTFVSDKLRQRFQCSETDGLSQDMMDELRRLAFEQIEERIIIERDAIDARISEITTASIN